MATTEHDQRGKARIAQRPRTPSQDAKRSTHHISLVSYLMLNRRGRAIYSTDDELTFLQSNRSLPYLHVLRRPLDAHPDWLAIPIPLERASRGPREGRTRSATARCFSLLPHPRFSHQIAFGGKHSLKQGRCSFIGRASNSPAFAGPFPS